MIEIQKGGIFKFESQIVDSSQVDIEEFLVANLHMPLSMASGLNTYDVIHFLYNIRDFIYKVHSEHYETIRAYLVASKTRVRVNGVILCKEATLEDDCLFVSPIIKFVHDGGGYKLCDTPISIDDTIYVNEDLLLSDDSGVLSAIVNSKTKSLYTLQDLIISLFQDFPSKASMIIS